MYLFPQCRVQFYRALQPEPTVTSRPLNTSLDTIVTLNV